jgi:hypothetical protein
MENYILEWDLSTRLDEERALSGCVSCLGELRSHSNAELVYIRPYPVDLGILYEIKKSDITKVVPTNTQSEKEGVLVYFKKEASIVRLEYRTGSQAVLELSNLLNTNKVHTDPTGEPGRPLGGGNYRRPW